MCFELDSLPPIAPISGAAVAHQEIVLESQDGTRYDAFAAKPEVDSTVGVVVLPDARGLYRFYEELALRFAERGYCAVAIDYFGRTAGLGRRSDDFDFMPYFSELTAEQVRLDVATAVNYLRSSEGGSCSSIFTVGFCFGGRHSWLAAADDHSLTGAIGFYGVPGPWPLPGPESGAPGPAQRAAELGAPILALQAGADDFITPDQNEAFEEALRAAETDYELIAYDGAPHSFFDRTFEEHAEASADAWRRVLAFIDEHRP